MKEVRVEDFPVLDFGDKRRGLRMVLILNNICRQPQSSIPAQNNNWYDTKATYNFYQHEQVSIEALQNTLAAYGTARLQGEGNRILVAHDISVLSYNNSPAEGLGYTGHKNAQGILCYSSLALSESAMPLALLYQHTWIRAKQALGKAAQRRKLPFEHKESYKWYQGISAVDEQLPCSLHRLHLCDREADIYELFAYRRPVGSDLLIRATHNRALEQGGLLWTQVEEQPAAACLNIEVPDSKGRHTTAVAVQVRFGQQSIRKPASAKHELKAVALTAIDVRQISDKHPDQKEPIHWKLLTTLELSSAAQAMQCVQWYCYRWLIERFHYVLKSGTQIEALQLGQAESLQKAIHVYSLAAVRIMQLVYQSRQTPQASCEVVLTKAQWIVLYMLIHHSRTIPRQAPTLQQAAYWMGKLGGHLGRKQDGPPGPKAIWLGYKKLCNALSLYEILNFSP